MLEEYFFGFDRDTPHDMRSAGKTFASVMLGAAMMRRGAKRSYREYEASGNGGQLLIVIPELELAVVFIAGNYIQGGI